MEWLLMSNVQSQSDDSYDIPIWRKYILSVQEASKYFHIGEIAFFDADIEKYDPETVPLD